VGELTSRQTERSLQIREQDLSVSVRLDGFEHLLVNNNLIRFALGRWLVTLLLLGEDVAFSLLQALFADPAEVGIIDIGGNLNLFNVQLGAGGDNVVLVDTTNWNSVDLVWTSDEEKTRFQGFQEDDPLSTVNTSQQNENGSGGQRLADFGGTNSLDYLALLPQP